MYILILEIIYNNIWRAKESDMVYGKLLFFVLLFVFRLKYGNLILIYHANLTVFNFMVGQTI